MVDFGTYRLHSWLRDDHTMKFAALFLFLLLQVAADALNAGVNLDGVLCYAPNMTFLNNWGPKAVNSGQVSSRVIKDALRRVLQVRFQTGVMSPPKEVSYSSLGEEQLGAPEHLKV